MAAVPAQLEPLAQVLPQLNQQTLEVCLRAAALHLQKRDGEIDAAGVKSSLASGGIASSPKKILGACSWLLKQAGKGGGQNVAKLEASLGPLGFEAHHIAGVTSVLDWVKAGAPADAGAAGGANKAAPSPAPAPAPKPAKEKRNKPSAGAAVEAPAPAPDLAAQAAAAALSLSIAPAAASSASSKKKSAGGKAKTPKPKVKNDTGMPDEDDDSEDSGLRQLHWAAISGEDAKVGSLLRKRE
eukprot:SAG11_NODE_2017_length_3918_cov_1.984027_3_plen_241_part_00